VTLLARNPAKIPKLLSTPGVTIVEGGLDDLATLETSLPGHDACIHNALIWEDEASELQLRDTRASVQLFGACERAGVEHLIYTSSTAVHRPFQGLMDERARLQPDDWYSATKAAAEAYLSAFSHRTAMRCNVIRPGPTVGGPALEGAPVSGDLRLRNIVDAALRGHDIAVVLHDGRQFVAARDLARLYCALLGSSANRETYLGVSRDLTLWEDVARVAVSLTGSGSRIRVEDRGLKPGRFDAGKIERDLGLVFDSQVGLRQHLAHLTAGLSQEPPELC